ncbi:hypothetical protein UFOVP978_9 [uncultured Caudovirales phage]|uniref:Portal protein n=1 Tax=uncultured Caudovirales phage TaxID=2100421 RepID=A0A6J5Q3Z0_9CAUD|nr:hypothetical protein UFOVP978_9 [uncultured Caudovirales phage]
MPEANNQEFPMYEELGASGLNRASGYIYEEPLVRLQGALGIKAYKEMALNDATISTILYAINTLVRQVKWEVEAFSSEADDEKNKAFLEECMDDMSHSWEDFICEVMSMIVYGWCGFEVIYKKRKGPKESSPSKRSKHDDNKIGWRKIAIRSQDTLARWEFGDDGSVTAMIQQSPPLFKMVTIPVQKMILFRTEGHKNNPEGKSLLRGAYRAWCFKKRIEEIEGIGIERDLAGLPIVYVPKKILRADASAEDKQMLKVFKEMVTRVRRDEQEGIVFPLEYDANGMKVYEFSLLTSGSRREFNTDQIITRWDQRIAMTVLADFVMLGHSSVGSFALSSDKTDIFALALGSLLNNIASVVNRHAVPKLFAVNALPLDRLPVIKPTDIETPDIGLLGSFLQVLGGLGVPMAEDGETVNWLRSMAGAPQLTEDSTSLTATTAASAYQETMGAQQAKMAEQQQAAAPAPGDQQQQGA